MVAFLILALLATCAVSLYSLQYLRIGGPLAINLARGNELIADILPPPKYIVETHLLVQQLVRETDPVMINRFIGDIDRLETQFRIRTEYWNAAALSPQIAEQLNVRSTKAANEYFNILHQSVIPQVKAGRNHLASAIMRSDLDYLYNRHRLAIDTVVELAHAESVDFSASAAMTSRQMIALVLASNAIALVVVGLGLRRMADGITRPLASTAEVMRRMAAGDESNIVLDVERVGEIGQMTRAFALMVAAVRQRDAAREEIAANLDVQNSELDTARAAAEAAVIAKDRFLANMSHEIRTPLNGVIGSLDIVGRGQLDDTQRRFCHTAKASSKSLLAMLSDVLDLSKLNAGKLELVSGQVPLRTLIVDVGEICRAAAKQSELVVSTCICPEVPGLITTDGTRLRQVLINLMTNAVKFTSSGEVALKVSVSLPDPAAHTDHPAPPVAAGAAPGTISLCFAVTDTGIGIPADRLNRLFKAFSQADVTTTRKFGGTGLGLAISQEIVGVLGGQIEVESTEGVGSTFFFTARFAFDPESLQRPDELGSGPSVRTIHNLEALPSINAEAIVAATEANHAFRRSTDSPVHPTAARPAGLNTLANIVPTESNSKTCILLVDDNEINRLIAGTVLESLGYFVVQAEDGVQAISQWKLHKPAAILMDCQMPEMDGYEASRQIRALEVTMSMPPTPIIALTANAMAGDHEKCLACGMTDFLTKPVEPERIEKVLRTWCLPGDASIATTRAA